MFKYHGLTRRTPGPGLPGLERLREDGRVRAPRGRGRRGEGRGRALADLADFAPPAGFNLLGGLARLGRRGKHVALGARRGDEKTGEEEEPFHVGGLEGVQSIKERTRRIYGSKCTTCEIHTQDTRQEITFTMRHD